MRRVRTIKRNKKDLLKNTGVVDDTNEVKSFIIIVAILVVLIVAIYAATELFGKKSSNDSNVNTGTINYDKMSVGMLLNRPYDEYYVIAYDSESNDAILYDNTSGMYTMSDKEDKIKLFYIDLNNELNKKYYNVNDDNKSNPKATSIEELDLGDLTLIHVKNGKIVKYLEDYTSIKKLLSVN